MRQAIIGAAKRTLRSSSFSSSLSNTQPVAGVVRGRPAAFPTASMAGGCNGSPAAGFSSQPSRAEMEIPTVPRRTPPPPKPLTIPPAPSREPTVPHEPPAAAHIPAMEEHEYYDPSADTAVAQPPSPAALAEQTRRVSVMAFYVGQNLDLISVVQMNFLSHRGYKISDNVLLVPLAKEAKDRDVIKSALVVFKHGSVVFFNVDDVVQSKYLHALMRHCGEVVPQSHRFRETLECRLRPWQEKYHEMGQDVVNIRDLNEDSIKVISDVIGHSVALNFYNKKADRMLEDFRVLNNSVESSGVFTEMDKKDLFKLVALNNKILTDAMSSGLLEQSKPAWNFNRLDALWNDLREEFSIGDRFAKVEHKINHVQSNTKFFLEILNHQKSNNLEWIIIVLIGAEIVLSCIDVHHQLFGI